MKGCGCTPLFLLSMLTICVGVVMLVNGQSLGWILIPIGYVCSFSGVRRRREVTRHLIRDFFIPPSNQGGVCKSCGDGRGYYIGDNRYLTCKFCGGRG